MCRRFTTFQIIKKWHFQHFLFNQIKIDYFRQFRELHKTLGIITVII